MRLLHRYLLWEFLRVFALACGGLLVVFTSIEALERIDTVMERSAPLGSFLLYMAMKVPIFLFEFLPFAILIGTIVSLGILGRRREILAMKVSGVGDYGILLPYLALSLVGSLVVFLGLELVNPTLMERCDHLWEMTIKGRNPKTTFQVQRIWLREGGRVVNVRLAMGEEILGVTVLYPEGDRMARRIEAQRGRWEGGVWELQGVRVLTFGPSAMREERLERLRMDLGASPEDFLKGMKEPEAMSFWELRGYVERLRREGFQREPYVVELQAKVSYPLSPLVLALVGVPMALRTGRRREGGIPQGIALSVFIGGLFYLTFALLVTLGQGQVLWPWLAAWGADIAFGALGVYLLETLRS